MPKILGKKSAARKTPVIKARRQPRKQKHQNYDIEDLLIDMIIKGTGKSVNGTDVENLIYCITPSTAELGYGFGFSVGRTLTLKLGQDVGLTSVLDKIGLHGALYYPLSGKAIITSRPSQRHQRFQINRNIHIYEAGVISGYLSTTTGTQVGTVEKRCIFNGSSECQFVSTPLSPKQPFAGIGIKDAATAIAHTINYGNYSKSDNEYYRILAYLPLTNTKLSEHILKVMFISGERLGELSGNDHLSRIVSNISNYFGARVAKIEGGRIKSIIKLRYESYNSTQAFVAVPVALLSGFANSTGSKARARFITNRNNSYTTIIELSRKRI